MVYGRSARDEQSDDFCERGKKATSLDGFRSVHVGVSFALEWWGHTKSVHRRGLAPNLLVQSRRVVASEPSSMFSLTSQERNR